MIVEYIGNDRVDAFVLPVTLVAAELQKMQPRRETELVAREATVYAEFSRGMNVAVVRKIGLVGLLDPSVIGCEISVLSWTSFDVDTQSIMNR